MADKAENGSDRVMEHITNEESAMTEVMAYAAMRITSKGMWVLTTHLNDSHNVTKWLSYEGAQADLERQLKPKRVKDRESVTGFRMVWPLGWTSITRERER